MTNNRDFLALALDNVTSSGQIEELIEKTSEWIGVYKIGLEQFTRFGPSVLDIIRRSGRKIFLDLKFHDIPNTVAKAVKSACSLGVDYLTIHTQGGLEMMKAAAESARQSSDNPPKIIGVTLLTSLGPDALKNELAVTMEVNTYVKHLASLAVQAGIDGIVCSAADLPSVKPDLPAHFHVITPGIRPAGADIGDQKRVATPGAAVKSGATLLVVGRPITGAEDPAKAAEEIWKETAVF
ncbi:MAG: orotidine-5'-phosphate decarboxylase [Fibrobacter sp.]|jgi:orotidine-5'-phosphate decarboxylase|nr:orotidine-5'-phosphate decarboxylase [Fibrobacter sp.]